jgi:hypothetical protein
VQEIYDNPVEDCGTVERAKQDILRNFVTAHKKLGRNKKLKLVLRFNHFIIASHHMSFSIERMPTKETMEHDDDARLSSDCSSSSSGSNSTAEESVKTVKHPWESYWRRTVLFGLLVVAITVIFSTFILVIRQDNEHFHESVRIIG